MDWNLNDELVTALWTNRVCRIGGPLNDSYILKKTFKYELVILSLKFFSKRPYKELSGGAPRQGYLVQIIDTPKAPLPYLHV